MVVEPAKSDRLLEATATQFLKRGALKQLVMWVAPSLVAVALFTGLILVSPRITDRLAQPGSPEAEGLQLKTLIRQVKKELQEADQEALDNNEAALFELKEFDLDVNILASGKTIHDAKVVTVGSNVEVGRERVQHIHLVWTAAREENAVVNEGSIPAKPTVTINADEGKESK